MRPGLHYSMAASRRVFPALWKPMESGGHSHYPPGHPRMTTQSCLVGGRHGVVTRGLIGLLCLVPLPAWGQGPPIGPRASTDGLSGGGRATPPAAAALLLKNGLEAARRGDWPGASRFYARAVEQAPDSKLARLLHGTA